VALGLAALLGSTYAGAAVTSAAGATSTGHAGPSGSVVVDTNRTPLTLDPAVSCGDESAQIIGGLYSQLTQYGTEPGPDGTKAIDPSKIVPYVASSWSVSASGLHWTFILKHGLKFPSGRPIDAAAVKYSINRVYTMDECGTAYINSGYKTRNILSVAAPSTYVVVFTLARPDSAFPQVLAQMAGSIVDESVVNQHGGIKANTINTWMQTHDAGGGAYLLSSYQPSQQVVLVANPAYTLTPAPGAHKLTVNIVTSQETLLLQAQSGAANLTLGLTPASDTSLKNDASLEVVADLTPLQEEINFVWKYPPFNNRLFREALTYAIPYQAVLKSVAFGYGKLYYGPVNPEIPGYDAAGSTPRPFDLAKARQLIKQSGVKTPVNTTIVVAQGNATEEQIATIAQGEWKQLGINLQVKTLSPAAFASGIFSLQYPLNVRLGGPAVLEFGYYTSYDNTCGDAFNVTATCLPANDALLVRARGEQNPAQRQALYDQYTRTWDAASPKIPVYASEAVAVLKKGTQGYVYDQNVDYRRLAAG